MGLAAALYWCGQMNRKVIKLTITLADSKETFTTEVGQNQLSSQGLRVLCDIAFGFGAVMPTAQIRVYGLALERMTKLLRVQWNTMGALLNMVKIEAGEQGKELALAFEGNITFAYPDFNAGPDVPLVIESQAAILENLKPTKSTTFKGECEIADVVKSICDDMGYKFENNGFSAKHKDLTINGTGIDKIKQLSSAHNFDLYIETGLIAIAPKNGARNIQVPIIKPSTGLIGYPVPDIKGVSFKCLYDPLLRFGGALKIEDSIIDVCNGEWRVYGLRISIEANQPNGNWLCDVNATWRNSNDAAIAK